MSRDEMETSESTMPWIVYRYGRTHDGWWPWWRSTRVLGRMCIGLECSVCGDRTWMWLPIPRFGDVPEPEGGKHPARAAYLKAHAHPDRGHPFSWVRPLRNMNVFSAYGGMDPDSVHRRTWVAPDTEEES